MTDIVKRLRKYTTATVGDLFAAAAEIETLCQRVKDLECDVEKWKAIANQINTDWIPANKKLNDELAALKAGQGEPVAWMHESPKLYTIMNAVRAYGESRDNNEISLMLLGLGITRNKETK